MVGGEISMVCGGGVIAGVCGIVGSSGSEATGDTRRIGVKVRC